MVLRVKHKHDAISAGATLHFHALQVYQENGATMSSSMRCLAIAAIMCSGIAAAVADTLHLNDAATYKLTVMVRPSS